MSETSYQINRQRRSKLSLLEQLGNIGSEVGRTFKAARNDDQQVSQKAILQALDLFDATLAAPERSFAERKEILRVREQFLKTVTTESMQPSLESYFIKFAIGAQNKRNNLNKIK